VSQCTDGAGVYEVRQAGVAAERADEGVGAGRQWSEDVPGIRKAVDDERFVCEWRFFLF